MGRTNYLCNSCFHEITNPICPVCFLREVEVWLEDRTMSSKRKEGIIEELTKLVNNLADRPSNTNCVLCGSRNVNLCMYCLVWKTERILIKHTKSKRTLENFEEIFNYNAWMH